MAIRSGLLAVVFLVACGGGGGSSKDHDGSTNNGADGGSGDQGPGSFTPHFACPLDKPQQAFGAGGTAELDSDTTWTADNVYLVFGAFSTGAHTLTIEPGTVVCFDYDTTVVQNPPPGMIEVASGGALVAEGTATSHITFTQKESGQPGFTWVGVLFDGGISGLTSLQYLDLYDAGSGSALKSASTGADGNNADPAIIIDNVHLYNLENKGIELAGANGWTGSITIHSYTGTDPASIYPAATIHPLFAASMTATSLTIDAAIPVSARVIQLGENIISKPVTLHDLGIPYRSDPAGIKLYGSGNVGDAGVVTAVLTIDPNVTLQMYDALDVGYHENGAADLVAAGVQGKPITFTAADATGWSGILFEMEEVRSTVSKLDFVTVTGAGKPGEFTISDCRDMQSSTIGGEIMIQHPSNSSATYAGPSITNTTIAKPAANTDGIRYDCNSAQCLSTDYTLASANILFSDFPTVCDATNANASCGMRPLGCI